MTIATGCITFLPMVEKNSKHHEFAERLSAEMGRKRLSVKDLSLACDVTYEMARRYTLGTAKPRDEKIDRIAKWLGVEPSWLEYGDSSAKPEHALPNLNPDSQPPAEAMVGVDDFTSLSDDERRLLRVFRQFPYIEARNMLLVFEDRYRKLQDFYGKK
ncbi:hypothetical protein MXF13_02145 [Leclercia adecarboxylata]|uniref:hypothetical protein n=1 Tax=Leclercia adecarboxylata TaxID=83655 RepID=UPI002DB99DFA|nr:hypothetical protein [Leclercia adecarboxylata]MEB5748690.1 hypothetical protein [Leclercia adecarboxylata]